MSYIGIYLIDISHFWPIPWVQKVVNLQCWSPGICRNIPRSPNTTPGLPGLQPLGLTPSKVPAGTWLFLWHSGSQPVWVADKDSIKTIVFFPCNSQFLWFACIWPIWPDKIQLPIMCPLGFSLSDLGFLAGGTVTYSPQLCWEPHWPMGTWIQKSPRYTEIFWSLDHPFGGQF